MVVNVENPLFKKLGMKYPIVEGGMTWAGTGALAAAISEDPTVKIKSPSCKS